MKYQELKEKQRKEINELPIYFAFGQKQLDEKAEELGFKNTDEMLRNVAGIGAGGFTLIKDYDKVLNTFKRHNEETRKLIDEDDEFVLDAFEYELGNHEYIITFDITDALSALNISFKMYDESVRLQNLMKQAKEKYLKAMESLGW